MTLIVAGISDGSAWMIGDTAITGGPIGLRERRFLPKIEVGQNFPALFGFAGAAELGARLVRHASCAGTAQEALDTLIDASREVDADFAVALIENGAPVLRRITRGAATALPVLHIGSSDAFSRFQRLRNERTVAAPKAFKHIMIGSSGGDVPENLAKALGAMCELFSETAEHDVGGWATPYLLTNKGTAFCGYVYSVSDPTFELHRPGDLIGIGTAELGGYSVSVTGLPNNDGMVVYTSQRNDGIVVLRESNGYATYRFQGQPSEFIAQVKARLSLDVSLFVGDVPAGPPKKLRILRGKDGNIDLVIADHGNAISYAVHNTAEEFHHRMSMNMQEQDDPELPPGIGVKRKDAQTVSLKIGDCETDLTGDELANLITELARQRAETSPAVSPEPKGASMMALDPRWRTHATLHPELPGILLSLQHPGHGWLGYMLPHNEAKDLGKWLVEHAKDHPNAEADK